MRRLRKPQREPPSRTPSWPRLRNAAFGQIQEALVEAQAAQKLAHLYHDQLRPQAEATLQSSVIAYENDKTDFLDLLDSQMTVIDVDLAWVQAVADFDTRLADLELATGTPLDKAQTTPGGETVKTRTYQIALVVGRCCMRFARGRASSMSLSALRYHAASQVSAKIRS